ncbi:hypothetical protein OG488_38990 (plasmid) [Streptomyces sp. NBC_01460]|uniref:hypothetical protein n=1 Tax=Streptomyces sp. NBC_01460 TaxID=2903875 RepID=UPI002E3546B6|nr:hypothetical protein [Streptomyces sp. NBC_01460]
MTSPTAPSPAPAPASHTWAVWLLVMVLFSVVVALLVIMLKQHSGSGLADAVLSGGAAFGSTMFVCLGVVAGIRELRRSR